MKRKLNALRNWLIRRLAGKQPVMLNMRIFGGSIEPRHEDARQGMAYGCWFDRTDTSAHGAEEPKHVPGFEDLSPRRVLPEPPEESDGED